MLKPCRDLFAIKGSSPDTKNNLRTTFHSRNCSWFHWIPLHLNSTKICQEIRNNFTESVNIRLIKLKAFRVQDSKDFVYDYYHIERSRMLPSLFFIRWAFSLREEKSWSAWRWLASFNVLLCKWNVFMDTRVGYPNKSYFHIFLSKDVLGAHLKCLKKTFWL